MSEKVLRIAVIGPESSGKSQLCEQLADYFETSWVKEYARTYLMALNRSYNLEDIVTIYERQFEIEQEMLESAVGMIFIDTEFIIAKVWCENAFHECPPLIEKMIHTNPYDLYLLTAPDLPWQFDPLRENPGKGDFFFNWYVRILEVHSLNYKIISGGGDQRKECAIIAVKEFLDSNSIAK